jgi:itaconate CoA-transferase
MSIQKPMRPLDGITVLAVEHAVAAPLCTRHLADMGARVIKIERPGTGDFARGYDQRVNGMSSYFVWANRSKESITLNLKHPDALAVLRQLAARSDVMVQNLAPGTAARMGLSYQALHEQHPRLICCDISGYGADGPYRDKKAYDLMVQAESGLMAATGTPEAMARAGISAADISAGMYAYSSILAALLLRARSGEGSHIDVAMFEALAEWMGNPLYYSYKGQPPPPRTGGAHPSVLPYGPTPVGDGQTVMLAVQTQTEWHNFCEIVLRQPELEQDARFASNPLRQQHRAALDAIIAECFAPLTRDEVEARLEQAQLATARVNNAADLWTHPQLLARQQWQEVASQNGPFTALLPPARNNCFAPRMDAVPAVGQHTDALLQELGYSAERIAALRAAQAV